MSNVQRSLLILTCSLLFANPAVARGFNFFHAVLTDAENVPPFASPTNARGKLSLRGFRGSLHYSLSASTLSNAFAAHIHCGAPGAPSAHRPRRPKRQ